MRRIFTFLVITIFVISNLFSQTLISQWTFPTGTAVDSLAGAGTSQNLALSVIKTIGGTSAIDFSKNGYTTFAPQATGWDNGNGTKCWQISIVTTGYDSVTISSRQQSGGANPGPGDFKLQYSIGTSGTWTDVPGGTITTANNWTTAWVNNLALPSSCSNQSLLYIRWIVNSNLSSTGGTVTLAGVSKIDDIFAYGKPLSTGISEISILSGIRIFPIPARTNFTVRSEEQISDILIYNILGKLVYSSKPNSKNATIVCTNLPDGTYIVRLKSGNSAPVSRKIIICR